MTRRDLLRLLTAAAAPLPFVGCVGDDAPVLVFGRDPCDWCRMTLVDRRLGGAVRTTAGRIFRFDTIECLAAWSSTTPVPSERIWLVDAAVPGRLRPLDAVRIHHDTTSRTSMGSAYRAAGRDAPSDAVPGAPVAWSAALAAIAANPASAGGTR